MQSVLPIRVAFIKMELIREENTRSLLVTNQDASRGSVGGHEYSVTYSPLLANVVDRLCRKIGQKALSPAWIDLSRVRLKD